MFAHPASKYGAEKQYQIFDAFICHVPVLLEKLLMGRLPTSCTLSQVPLPHFTLQ